jgi:uncharacterized protein YciI
MVVENIYPLNIALDVQYVPSFASVLYQQGKQPMARFVLWGLYCEDALEKRVPFRDEHLARLQRLKDDGTLITLGPTEGSTHVFGVFESESESAVRALLQSDVYWREGIWTRLDIYSWIQAF